MDYKDFKENILNERPDVKLYLETMHGFDQLLTNLGINPLEFSNKFQDEYLSIVEIIKQTVDKFKEEMHD